jgi:hypothetical protein
MNSSFSWPNGCQVAFDRYTSSVGLVGNLLYLLANNGSTWLGPLQIGEAGQSLSNSQCTLYSGTSSISGSGNNVTLDLDLGFASGFGGSTWTYVFDRTLNASGWVSTGSWNLVSQTIATTPAGMSITIDGTAYTAPQTFSWGSGSAHTIATTSPQTLGGTQYAFSSWSDGGAISHTIDASATTDTASFATSTSYSISGTVKAGGIALSGVTVTLSGSQSGSAITGASGTYSFSVTSGGNYTVTPSVSNYTFSPASTTFNDLTANQSANFTGLIQTIAQFASCVSSTGATNACILSPNSYPVSSQITVGRSNVVIGGGSTNLYSTLLIRAQSFTSPMMQIGPVAVTGVVIQNLTFCGGDDVAEGDPRDPCPHTANSPSTCQSNASLDCIELFITSTAGVQPWAVGPINSSYSPFNNTGPYNITIQNDQFEDLETGHLIFVSPNAAGEVVNDIWFTGNIISSSGVQMGTYNSSTNWEDYTQCDNWQYQKGTVFADDETITIPRDIRFSNNTFYANAGAISGTDRYVQFSSNTITQWQAPSSGGGGSIEQDVCSDQIMITGNTLTGGFPGTSGMELYARNVTVGSPNTTGGATLAPNTVYGYAAEGVGLLSAYNALVNYNYVSGNATGTVPLTSRSRHATRACLLAPPVLTCSLARRSET